MPHFEIDRAENTPVNKIIFPSSRADVQLPTKRFQLQMLQHFHSFPRRRNTRTIVHASTTSSTHLVEVGRLANNLLSVNLKQTSPRKELAINKPQSTNYLTCDTDTCMLSCPPAVTPRAQAPVSAVPYQPHRSCGSGQLVQSA